MTTSQRYEVKEKIARGGLGVVYRAFDSNLNREVAIKRIFLDSGEPIEELTANLVKEAKILSALKHPHIVTIHDVGEDEEGPYVVMELLEGETLDAIIKRAALTPEDFNEFVVQTMEGMVAAQSVDLLHRDLKPANIMIVMLPSGKFQVKILDFGLAKFFNRPSAQTVDQSDSLLGSIFFMAPEQFERAPLDGRTDLYSIGAIFYYALAGQYPFQGDSQVEVMNSHLDHTFTPLKEIRPDISDSVCAWVERLMARKMEDRPLTAKEALAEWNPEPAIDEDQLREVASGDPQLAADLLADFLEETRGLIEQLNRELKEGQGAQAADTARTIRGTASTLGYSDIISIASEIEENAQSDMDRCRLACDRFSSALERLQGAVARLDWKDQNAAT